MTSGFKSAGSNSNANNANAQTGNARTGQTASGAAAPVVDIFAKNTGAYGFGTGVLAQVTNGTAGKIVEWLQQSFVDSAVYFAFSYEPGIVSAELSELPSAVVIGMALPDGTVYALPVVLDCTYRGSRTVAAPAGERGAGFVTVQRSGLSVATYVQDDGQNWWLKGLEVALAAHPRCVGATTTVVLDILGTYDTTLLNNDGTVTPNTAKLMQDALATLVSAAYADTGTVGSQAIDAMTAALRQTWAIAHATVENTMVEESGVPIHATSRFTISQVSSTRGTAFNMVSVQTTTSAVVEVAGYWTLVPIAITPPANAPADAETGKWALTFVITQITTPFNAHPVMGAVALAQLASLSNEERHLTAFRQSADFMNMLAGVPAISDESKRIPAEVLGTLSDNDQVATLRKYLLPGFQIAVQRDPTGVGTWPLSPIWEAAMDAGVADTLSAVIGEFATNAHGQALVDMRGAMPPLIADSSLPPVAVIFNQRANLHATQVFDAAIIAGEPELNVDLQAAKYGYARSDQSAPEVYASMIALLSRASGGDASGTWTYYGTASRLLVSPAFVQAMAEFLRKAVGVGITTQALIDAPPATGQFQHFAQNQYHGVSAVLNGRANTGMGIGGSSSARGRTMF